MSEMKPGIIIKLDNQYGTYGMVTGQTGSAITVQTENFVLAYEPEYIWPRIIGLLTVAHDAWRFVGVDGRQSPLTVPTQHGDAWQIAFAALLDMLEREDAEPC